MVFNNSILLGAGGQTTGQAPFDTTLIGNSVWLDGSADCLTKSLSSGAAQSRLIISTWVQRNKFSGSSIYAIVSSIGGAQSSNANILQFQNDKISVRLENTSGATSSIYQTSAVYRDIGWYHVLLSVDGNVSASMKLFVNGIEQETSITTGSAFTGSLGSFGHSGATTMIGKYNNTESNFYFLPGYLTQTTMIVGQSIQNGDLTVSDFLDTYTFGTNGSQFIPKADADIAALASTAGGNSFCLDFANSSDLGNDISSNNNDFTPTSMDSTNQSISTPSKTYSIFNPIAKRSSAFTLSNGNRTAVTPTFDQWMKTTVPFVMSGSKIIRTQFTFSTVGQGGVGITGSPHTTGTYHTASNSIAGRGEVALLGNGALTIDGTFNNSYTSALSNGDVVDVIVNLEVGAVYFAVNGTLLGGATESEIQAGTTTNAAQTGGSFVRRAAGEIFNYYILQFNPSASTIVYNSGQTSFTHSYSNITSLISLNTADLTAPDFQGIDYFDATLYEGNGQGQRVGDFVPYTDTYTVSNSAMWYSEDIRKLKYNYSSEAAATSDTTKQATLSFWIKFVETADTDQQVFLSQSDSSQQNRFIMYVSGTNSEDAGFVMIQVSNVGYFFKFNKHLFNKDAWSHCLLHLDTDNSTAADRMKLWIDAVPVINLQTGSSAYTNLPQGSDLNIFRDTLDLFVGHLSPGSTYASVYNFNSYLAEYHLIDGSLQSLTNFGEIDTSTNRWVPKDYKTNVGTYGNRGFYLKFDGTPGASTGSNMGKDSSGNGLNLTEEFGSGGSAWTTTDKFVDTPSKNFTTFDSGYAGGGSNVFSEGNTKVKGTDGSLSDTATTTFGMTGKVVFQFKMNTVGGGYPQPGFITSQAGLEDVNVSSGSVELGTSNCAGSFGYNAGGSFKIPNSTTSTTFSSLSAGQALDADDVIRFEVDTDAGTVRVYFQDEGTGSFTEITGARVDNFNFDPSFGVRPAVSNYNNSEATLQTGGQTTLSSVSTDFLEINQDNLDDTASKLTAWAWIKNRDASSDHMLFDRIRGVNKDIHSNSTNAEVTNQSTLQRFLQRGVQVGADSTVNNAGNSFVLWQWLLGDSATTGSTNTEGSLNTSVIAADAGHFSVVSWTMSDPAAAKTLGHGLSGAPELIIVKNRTDAGTNWPVFSEFAGNTKYQYLSTTAAAATFNMWQNTSPTSTVFSVSSNNEASGSANDEMIAYCFRSVPGVCKVGVYVGNNTDDNAYVSLGFTPRFFMCKMITGSSQWHLIDSARSPTNEGQIQSFANLNNAEQNSALGAYDLLSDGIKIRSDAGFEPGNTGTWIYMAMADIAGNGTLPPIYGR